jgi:hypothetical protein
MVTRFRNYYFYPPSSEMFNTHTKTAGSEWTMHYVIKCPKPAYFCYVIQDNHTYFASAVKFLNDEIYKLLLIKGTSNIWYYIQSAYRPLCC